MDQCIVVSHTFRSVSLCPGSRNSGIAVNDATAHLCAMTIHECDHITGVEFSDDLVDPGSEK